jgi:RND family efflux transporter MFP subunit
MQTKWIAIIASVGGACLGIISVLAVQNHSRPSSAMTTGRTKDAAEKQWYTCGMHPQVIQDHPGNCPICHMKLTPLKSGDNDDAAAATQPTGAKGERKVLYWWDPMLGPSSISPTPGKSAMGMEMAPVYEDQGSAGPAVKIDPAIVQNMGVRTAVVTRAPLVKTVRAVAVIESPESGFRDITLKVNGFVEKLYANQEGMHVRQGDPLLEIYSPDLQVAEEELISAVRANNALDKSASGEAVRKESENLVASAKRKLRLWDVAEEDIESLAKLDKAPRTVIFRSPAHGEIVDKAIVQGSAIASGMKLMRIEDHSKMWLKVQVYEEQMPVVKLGQTVEASLEALPGETFAGPITFIYPHLDHMARTSIVRVTIDNPELKLRPGMYATAKILTQPVPDAILVPREAVIDTGTRQIAFIVQSEGRFSPRRVRMGMSGDDDVVQILEGLAPGETVVTSGQFLMDVESRTTEAIYKLRGMQTPALQSERSAR